MLTSDQENRYNRQLIINDIGRAGQEKLFEAKVLIIGAGGLGSSAILYLAAAGVGTIGIADSDKVELSNLQRQIIHKTTDLKRPKVDSAKNSVNDLNPDVKVITYETKVGIENFNTIAADYDFVVDATDNFTSKFVINDVCVSQKKAYSHAGVLGFLGQTFTYLPGNTCLRCFIKEPPGKGDAPDPAEEGIIGFVPGIIGSIQAGEAVRFILKTGSLLTDRLLYIDSLNMDFRNITLKRDKSCPACGSKPK